MMQNKLRDSSPYRSENTYHPFIKFKIPLDVQSKMFMNHENSSEAYRAWVA